LENFEFYALFKLSFVMEGSERCSAVSLSAIEYLKRIAQDEKLIFQRFVFMLDSRRATVRITYLPTVTIKAGDIFSYFILNAMSLLSVIRIGFTIYSSEFIH